MVPEDEDTYLKRVTKIPTGVTYKKERLSNAPTLDFRRQQNLQRLLIDSASLSFIACSFIQ
jgi:hypothetical protein